MEKKRVLVCCANGVATSTMVSMKCKKKFEELCIPVELKTCSSYEVKSKAVSFKPDLIISNVGKGITVPDDVPIVYGVNLLSGRGAEETWKEIEEVLKK